MLVSIIAGVFFNRAHICTTSNQNILRFQIVSGPKNDASYNARKINQARHTALYTNAILWVEAWVLQVIGASGFRPIPI